MNQQERDKLASMLIELAIFYGKNDATKNSISQFINLLERFYKKELDEYLGALEKYCDDPTNKFFPTPANLRKYLDPKASPRDQGLEVAQRCFGAIKKFGYTKPEQARAYIGELGWKLIQNRGGWYFHCTETLEREIPNLTAQFRDTLETYVHQGIKSDEDFFDKMRVEWSNKQSELLLGMMSKK